MIPETAQKGQSQILPFQLSSHQSQPTNKSVIMSKLIKAAPSYNRASATIELKTNQLSLPKIIKPLNKYVMETGVQGKDVKCPQKKEETYGVFRLASKSKSKRLINDNILLDSVRLRKTGRLY